MTTRDQKKNAPGCFHTETFTKMDASRKEAFLNIAIAEFAAKGLRGTSINALAKKAGISIGALYSYFPSKDDLFLSIVERGRALLADALGDIDSEAPFLETFASLVRKARDYALSNPDLNLIYLDATTQGLRHLAARLSSSLETLTVDLYYDALTAAIRRGEIRADLDIGATAFCLDNILVLFQFSFASDYYRDRLHIFLRAEEGTELNEEALMAAIVDFARRSLST